MRTRGGAGGGVGVRLTVLAWVLVVGWRGVDGSRVWVDEAGGYRDVLAVLHPAVRPHNCTAFFGNLEAWVGAWSQQLWRATRGDVHVASVGVVVPRHVWQACGAPLPSAGTWHTWGEADITVGPAGGVGGGEWAWGPEGVTGVGVSQPEGCGRPGHRIAMDSDILTDLTSDDLPLLSRVMVGAWARYRWGVFEERGYRHHPRYPSTHIRDGAPTPTACTDNPTAGRWVTASGSDQCQEVTSSGDESECQWVPDAGAPRNTSLLYRSDLPSVWEFCDESTHDPDSPTPHNLLCGGNSVWTIMQRHPDFEHPHATTSTTTTTTPPSPHPPNPSPPPVPSPTSPTVDKAVNKDVKESPLATEDTTEGLIESSSELNLSFPTPTGLPGVAEPRQGVKVVGDASGEIQAPQGTNGSPGGGEMRPRRKRSDVGDFTPMRPSLVAAHLSSSSSATDVTLTSQSDPGTRSSYANASRRIDVRHEENENEKEERKEEEGRERKKEEEEEEEKSEDISWSYLDASSSSSSFSSSTSAPPPPPPPDVVFLAPPPSALVLALDLSDDAIAQVQMDELRGGVLRWLWGLGKGVKVGVVAAYRNSSYPLTLGPLLPAPTTAAALEDELALLPSAVEVESGAYGGAYCLDCVLEEAEKMLASSGVPSGGGTLLLAACTPNVTPAHLHRDTPGTIHTLALCPSTSFLLDQLARPGGAWVLPGPPPGEGNEAGERRVAEVLTRATQNALAFPGDPVLTKVGGVVVSAGSSDVLSSGPYSILEGQVTLPRAKDSLLIVITTQHHAKIVEVTNPSGNEVDLIRDTNQRFWAVLGEGHFGNFTYTLKFLTSSVAFPLPLSVDVYARKPNMEGVEVALHTSNHANIPLAPGSPPLVVWARVTRGGRAVVGARVVLHVSRLGEGGSAAHTTLELLDDGNAEPDVRAQDGVYTRYLTWLPGEGRYALTALATDRQGAASLLRPRRRDGRVVPVSAGQFVVSSGTVALTVERVTSEDLVPPSRVTDLAVTPLHETYVNLTWTAPGGDLDQGTAWQYELKMYTERDALSEHRFNSSTIAVYCITQDLRTPTPPPAPHGTPQHCLTELPFTNLRWYFAIRAVDAANNTGQISNIVSAFVPDLPTTPQTHTREFSSIQTVIMSTIHSPDFSNVTSPPGVTAASPDWRVWVAVGVVLGGMALAIGVVVLCMCCCRRGRRAEKDPDRPVYKIYVNNAYIQEEDGEIKVVSNGKLVDDKEPSQVQEWVNSLSKFGSSDVYGGEAGEAVTNPPEAPLVECRPRASVKYASPVRFGVLTNGSIMREGCQSSSSTSSSKPEDAGGDDVKYRDLSETTSNSTTDGGASAASTATTDTAPLPPPPIPLTESARAVPVSVHPSDVDRLPPPPPPPPPVAMPQPLGIPGPTVISIHAGPSLNSGYSSDEDGGFRPRTVPGPGPRRYLPTHFSSFRYLPPPPEYRTAVGGSVGISGAVDYPTCHTISRAATTLPHGTVRSVKKRRHISFV